MQQTEMKSSKIDQCICFTRSKYIIIHISDPEHHTYRLPKSFSWNHWVKSNMAVPRSRGNSAELSWNQSHAATPFTKLCAITSTRSLLSQVTGHQISVNRLRNAGESCKIHNDIHNSIKQIHKHYITITQWLTSTIQDREHIKWRSIYSYSRNSALTQCTFHV